MNLLLHTNHPKRSGLKQHYWIIWAHEPNDLGCAPLVALTFCDRLLSTKLDGSGCWLVVGWAHSSLITQQKGLGWILWRLAGF